MPKQNLRDSTFVLKTSKQLKHQVLGAAWEETLCYLETSQFPGKLPADTPEAADEVFAGSEELTGKPGEKDSTSGNSSSAQLTHSPAALLAL